MANNPIKVEKIDLEKHKEKITELPGLIEFAHNVGSAVVKPEDMGKVKGKAVAAMQEQTDAQMMQLYGQMQTLIDQAKGIKQRVSISIRIYQSKMNFEPVISHTYYLYNKKDGTDVLSMVSPEEWGSNTPFEECLAKVKLLADHTWEVLEGEVKEG